MDTEAMSFFLASGEAFHQLELQTIDQTQFEG